MITNPRKRSHPLKLQITPVMYADLVAVSEAMGQTPSTIAAVAVGQWVSTHKRNLALGEAAMEKTIAAMAPEMVEQMKLYGGKQ